ncbi:coenzyme F420-0:L-glutamate ligase [Paenarthrobacter nicotinovorans]|uniref:coenzyme F420-0:L-glutamate ligase n=1 Tax=Paenarthrobacter nicotinovorans TaxID=29320 RepID=UPI0038190966
MYSLSVFTLEGIPEIASGDDLGATIGHAMERSVHGVEQGDILVVTSKIVSKAEGRQIAASDREEAITAESVRLVASRPHPGGVTRIVETRHGLVLAAAGVDNSNTPEGTVLLLPIDPDASARKLCVELRRRFGLPIGVIVSDTLGRPWREGQTDAAIGAAGVKVMDDYRGTRDHHGNLLMVSAAAVADEIAGAADLVKGKTSGCPVAVVRGLGRYVVPLASSSLTKARDLVRPAHQDMFRLGSDEAYSNGYRDGHASATITEAAASIQQPETTAPGLP